MLDATHQSECRPNDDWKGFSGSGLLVDGYFVGVVVQAHTDRLRAWPAAALAEDQSFVDALGYTLNVVTESLWPEDDLPLLRNLQSWDVRIADPIQPARILSALYEEVPFDTAGRSDELALLESFVSDHSVSVGVLTIAAPGGTGKTRLALEFCRRMRRRGWLAGFLVIDPDADMRSFVGGTSPRLVVVDYPETNIAATLRLLRAAAYRRTGPMMRILLLARDGDHWLRHLADSDDRVGEIIDSRPVHQLSPLYPSEEARIRGFAAASSRFRSRLLEAGDEQSTALPPCLTSGTALSDNALYLHMQALLAVYGEGGARGGGLLPENVLLRILAHERRFWSRFFESTGTPATARLINIAERLAASLVLCGPAPSHGALVTLFRSVEPLMTDAEATTVAVCFNSLYPTAGGGAAPISPDLLAESLVASVLREAPDFGALRRLIDVPWALSARCAVQVLTVLTRLARRGIGREWLEDLLRRRGVDLIDYLVRQANHGSSASNFPPSVLAAAIDCISDGSIATTIMEAVPPESVELRQVEFAACSVAVSAARMTGDLPHLGGLLWQLGRCLAALGRRSEAMAAVEEATIIFRDLERLSPGAYQREVALCFQGLAAALGGLGRTAEALDAIFEAVRTFEEVPPPHSVCLVHGLARAYNVMGVNLGALGRGEEAVAAMTKASEYFLASAEGDSDTLAPDIALVHHNLGAILSDLGRLDDALVATQRALAIRRKLATANPDAFLPDLAMSLLNLGRMLALNGRASDAIAAVNESVSHYRTLVATVPDAFSRLLALALTNAAVLLSTEGAADEALAAVTEAVSIGRILADAERHAVSSSPELAMSLHNLGVVLAAMSRFDEAVVASEESVLLYQELSVGHPAIYLPELARALLNLCAWLHALGSADRAREFGAEAVRHYESLAEDRPEVFLRELSAARTNLAKIEDGLSGQPPQTSRSFFV